MDMLVLGCLAPQNAKNWRVKPLGARMTRHDRAHTSSDTSQIVLHQPCFVWLAFKTWDADNICVLGHQTSEALHSWGTSAYIKKRNVVLVSPRSFNHSDPSVCVFPNPRWFNDLARLGATHQKFTDGHWGFCVCCLPARNWGRLSTSKHRLACPKLYAALSTRSGQLPTTCNDLMNCVWYVVAHYWDVSSPTWSLHHLPTIPKLARGAWQEYDEGKERQEHEASACSGISCVSGYWAMGPKWGTNRPTKLVISNF